MSLVCFDTLNKSNHSRGPGHECIASSVIGYTRRPWLGKTEQNRVRVTQWKTKNPTRECQQQLIPIWFDLVRLFPRISRSLTVNPRPRSQFCYWATFCVGLYATTSLLCVRDREGLDNRLSMDINYGLTDWIQWQMFSSVVCMIKQKEGFAHRSDFIRLTVVRQDTNR